MRAAVAKKARREARRMVSRATRREVRWWAHPRVLRVWALPATRFVHLAVLLGWRSLGQRWLAFVRSVPARGTRFVVRTS